MTDQITQMLDALAEFKAQRDLVEVEKQALIDTILTPEMKEQIAQINEEFARNTEAVSGNITRLEDEIRTAVIAHGESVKGSIFHAVYSAGRTPWDKKGLERYARTHPEVMDFKQVGEPSVAIKIAK